RDRARRFHPRGNVPVLSYNGQTVMKLNLHDRLDRDIAPGSAPCEVQTGGRPLYSRRQARRPPRPAIDRPIRPVNLLPLPPAPAVPGPVRAAPGSETRSARGSGSDAD